MPSDLDLYVSNTAQAAAFVHDAAIDGAELIVAIGMRTRPGEENKPLMYLSSRVPDDFDVQALLAFMAQSRPEYRDPRPGQPADERPPVSATRGGVCLLCGECHGAAEPCRPAGDLP